MNDISISTPTPGKRMIVTAHPVSASGTPVALDGTLMVALDSGDGAFTPPDAAKPLEFEVFAGSGDGATIFGVSGRDLSGTVKSGKVTFTVAQPLADLGLTASEPPA